MKYETARQMVHDSFADRLSPDLIQSLLNLPKGTGFNNNLRILHQVMAGKVQNAIGEHVKANKAYLTSWALICFAPEDFISPGDRIVCEGCLFDQLCETKEFADLKDQWPKVMRITKMTIDNQISLNRNPSNRKLGRIPYNRKDMMISCGFVNAGGKDYEHWRNHYQPLVVRIETILGTWTGQSLAPVAKVLDSYRFANDIADEAI